MAAFDHYCRWLVAAGLGIIGFGVFMVVASGTPLFGLFNRFIDPSFWRDGTPPAGTEAFRAWVYGVWGATLAGWGVVVTLVAREAFRRREPWAWRALALGTGLWFVLDTGLSIVHGVLFNVAFNVVVLLLVAIPLARTRRHFR